MISEADKAIANVHNQANHLAIAQNLARDLDTSLSHRLQTVSPSFRAREAILSIRRTAFGLAVSPLLKPQIGNAWLTTSKIARKAGYEQTAYSAALQAQEVNAPFAFLQQAKLSRAHGGAFKALTELENAVSPLLGTESTERSPETFMRDRGLAKVS